MTLPLFVYGTLLRGENAQSHLALATFLGEAQTPPAWTLVHLGAYPALVPGGAQHVSGELYAIPAALWPALDAFEGVPTLYQRVELELADGGRAQAYIMEPAQVVGRAAIASGSWRER